MTLRLPFLLRLAGCAGLVLSVAACGGGGSGGASGDGTPSVAATRVAVKASSLSELEDLCDGKGAIVLGPVEGTDYYLVEIPAGVSQHEFLEDLDDEVEVEDAEEDSDEVAFPEGGGLTIPAFADDPTQSVGTQAALARIGADLAHLRGYLGEGVVVAVIDTGIDASHPLLLGHVAPGGYDFVDNDANPSDAGNGIDDDRDGVIDEGVGHGTFVEPDPRRVLRADPAARAQQRQRRHRASVGSPWLRGLHGAKVINLSAGVAVAQPIKQAVANARRAGVIVVAGAADPHRGLPRQPGGRPRGRGRGEHRREGAVLLLRPGPRPRGAGPRPGRRAPAPVRADGALVRHLVQHGARGRRAAALFMADVQPRPRPAIPSGG
jgi:hypothetical protein